MAKTNRPQARTATSQRAGGWPSVPGAPFAALRGCVAWTLALGLTLSSSPAEAQSAPPAKWGPPEELCQLSDPRLSEVSGIAASRRFAQHYYVHNDSGNPAEVFLIERSGRVRAVFELSGATNVDWEDIAIAPGETPGRYDVVVADIGDNKARRDDVRLYRFPEPDLPAEPAARVSIKPSVFALGYAEGPRNAEAFFVHPRTGCGYILTKREDATSEVYELPAPWSGREKHQLKRVATARLPGGPAAATIITAADISPDGGRIVARSYAGGWEWEIPFGGEPRQVLAAPPRRLELAAEPQGEAIAISADGRALLTISEGSPTRIYECPLESNTKP